MASSTWTFTVAATSPMYTYHPYTSNTSTGWKTYCTTSGWRCDENTAHVTGAPSTVSLSFNGTGIALYGNATASMSVSARLDDGTNATQGLDASSQLLASFSGLEQKEHTVTLTVDPSSPAALLYFTESVVTVDTGIANATMNSIFYDDLSLSLAYGPYWYPYPGYEGTVPPSNSPITSTTFHASDALNTTASLRFNGSAIFLYGPCYSSCGEYSVQMTPGDVNLTMTPTTPAVDVGTSVMESCLRYFATGLEADVEREISLQSLQNGSWATIDYIQVVSFESEGASPTAPAKSSASAGAIAGGVVGGVTILLSAIFAVFLCCRRRKRSSHSELAPHPFQPRLSLVPAAVPRAASPGPASSTKSSVSLSPLPVSSSEAERTPSTAASAQNNGAIPMVRRGTEASIPTMATAATTTTAASLPYTPSTTSGYPSFVPPTSPSLSQISNDVNRIIYQLGRLGRPLAPGEVAEEEEDVGEEENEEVELPTYTATRRGDRGKP